MGTMLMNDISRETIIISGVCCCIFLLLLLMPFLGIGLMGDTTSFDAAARTYTSGFWYIWLIPLLFSTVICGIHVASEAKARVFIAWGAIIIAPGLVALIQLDTMLLNWNTHAAGWTSRERMTWGALPMFGLIVFTLIFFFFPLAGWLANRKK